MHWLRIRRQPPPVRLIGHPEIGRGESCERGGVRYISVDEAVYRLSRGESAEIRFVSTPEDDAALADFRKASRERLDALREAYRRAHRVRRDG